MGKRNHSCPSQLRRGGEHFDEVVVQCVIELALKLPGELRTVKVAGMNLKYIRVHGSWRILQVDEDFDDAICFAS